MPPTVISLSTRLRQSAANVLTSHFVSTFLGLVLLAAAALKGHELATQDIESKTFWTSRGILTCVVLAELGLGMWLLAGLHPTIAQYAAAAWFSALTVIALGQAHEGQPTCRCLGRASLNPWTMSFFDIGALALTLMWRPSFPVLTVQSQRARVFLCGGVYLALAIPGLMQMIEFAPEGISDSLRADSRLGTHIELQSRTATTAQILQHISKSTGLALTADDGIRSVTGFSHSLGDLSVRKTPAWSLMEFVAQKQPVPARWERTPEGYQLTAVAAWGSATWPWGLGILAIVGLCAVMLFYGENANAPSFMRAARALTPDRIGALTLFGLMGVSAWLSSTWKGESVPNLGLVIDQKELELGDVWETRRFVHELTIQNPTRDDVEILDVAFSSCCVSSSPTALVVPAGSRARVRLTMDLGTIAPSETLGSRDLALRIVPRFRQAQPREVGWTLAGNIRSALVVSPRSVRFPENLVRGRDFPSQTFRVKSLAGTEQLAVRCEPPIATTRVRRSPVGEHEYHVDVVPLASLPRGSFRATLLVAPVLNGGQQLPEVGVPVQGVVLEEIEPSPNALVFGARQVGTIATETVLLASGTGRNFDLVRVTVASAGCTVLPLDLHKSGRAFQVTQQIIRPGHTAGTVRFTVSCQSKGTLTIDLPISYLGLPNPVEPK